MVRGGAAGGEDGGGEGAEVEATGAGGDRLRGRGGGFLGRAVGVDRLGAGLQEEQVLAVREVGVEGPLDVLRAAVVLLGTLGHGGDLHELVVGEAAGGGALGGDVATDEAAGGGVWDQLVVLVAEVLADDLQGDLVQDDVVRGDLAGDDHLADAPGGVDGHLGAVTVGGVEGHGDAGDAGVDHLLHDDGHGQTLVGDVVLEAVDDRAGGVEGGPALTDVLGDGVDADLPQVGVLLAGEGGVGQVLGGGRRTDRDGNLAAALLHELRVRLEDGGAGRGGDGQRAQRLADLGGELLDGGDVVGVDTLKRLVELVGDPGLPDEGVEGLGGDDEAGRDGHPGGGHAHEGGSLAAEGLEGGFPAVVEVLDVDGVGHVRLQWWFRRPR